MQTFAKHAGEVYRPLIRVSGINLRLRRVVLWTLVIFIFMLPVRGDATEAYVIDPDHSAIMFRIKHLGITFVYGIFPNAMGRYSFADTELENASIDIRVNVADVDTGNVKRDKHLQSPDFFDAAHFPHISFKSQSITMISTNRYTVEGNLSLHGVTKPVRVVAEKTGTIKDSRGVHRSGFETHFKIKRSDFGMQSWTGVANTVYLTVSIEGVKQENP